jgi:hypothetical protein
MHRGNMPWHSLLVSPPLFMTHSYRKLHCVLLKGLFDMLRVYPPSRHPVMLVFWCGLILAEELRWRRCQTLVPPHNNIYGHCQEVRFERSPASETSIRSSGLMGLDAFGMHSSRLFCERPVDNSLTVERHPRVDLVQYQMFGDCATRIWKQLN